MSMLLSSLSGALYLMPTVVRPATDAQSWGSVHLFKNSDRRDRPAEAGGHFGQEHAAFAREPLTETAAASAFERGGVRPSALDD
jgi:hypothetical protein